MDFNQNIDHFKGDKELMEVLKEIPKEDVEILLIKLNTLKKQNISNFSQFMIFTKKLLQKVIAI